MSWRIDPLFRFGVWVVAVGLLLAGCGLTDTDQVEVEVVDLEALVRLAEPVGDDIWLWLEDEQTETGGASELLRFDPVSAQVTQRVPIPRRLLAPQFLVDGSVHFSQTIRDDPPLEGIPVLGDESLLDGSSNQILVEIDLDSGQPVAQFVLPGPDLLRPVLDEGSNTMWYSTGVSRYAGVNLESGDIVEGPIANGVGSYSYPAIVDGWVWQFGAFEVVKIDPVTGETVLEFDLDRPAEIEEPLSIAAWTLEPHDGRYWLPGDFRLDPDNLYEFDPETGEVGETSVPIDEVPTVVEVGDLRWERFPESDGWMWTNVDSGETSGEFDFGSFTPLAELGGDLFLFSSEEGQIGRIPLEDVGSEDG